MRTKKQLANIFASVGNEDSAVDIAMQDQNVEASVIVSDSDETVAQTDVIESAAEVDNASTDIDKLIVAATALNNIAGIADNTPDMSPEVVAMASVALASVAETIAEESAGLESVADNLRSIAKNLYELIKRFFVNVLRAFGFFKTRAEVAIRKIDLTLGAIKAKKEGSVRHSFSISASGRKALCLTTDVQGHGEVMSRDVAADLEKSAAIVHRVHDHTIPTIKATINDLLGSAKYDTIKEALNRLLITDSNLGGSMLGCKRVISSSNGYSYLLVSDSTMEETDDVITVDTHAVVKILTTCKKILEKSVQLESRHKSEYDQLQKQLIKLTEKGLRSESPQALQCAQIMKDAVNRMFQIETALLQSATTVAYIFTRLE